MTALLILLAWVLSGLGVVCFVARAHAYFIHADIEQGKRVRCEVEATDMDIWEREFEAGR